MKYMLLIYGNEENLVSLSAGEFDEIVRETDILNRRLLESGELVGAYGVADALNALVVNVHDGVTTVTDGPYAEAKEHLGSFTIVDCDSLDRALEIAAANPAARYVGVEIRPLMTKPRPGHVDSTTNELALVRRLAPEVLGALVRRGTGTSTKPRTRSREALVAATVQVWPIEGRPTSPKAWLLTVAARRLANRLRSDEARRRREQTEAFRLPTTPPDPAPSGDDTLTLLFLCCHPALPRSAQAALTLRAVGGLTTAEIAAAYLVPEPTMAQRISRAKQRISASGGSFRLPPAGGALRPARRRTQVLYLLFNEGYTAMAGPDLIATDLTAEAVRLTRGCRDSFPTTARSPACSRLMLLIDARRPARTGADGGSSRSPSRTGRCGTAPAIDEGHRPSSPHRSPAGRRPVPAASRDRRGARRGADGRRDRLAADPRRCTRLLERMDPATRRSPSTGPSPRRWCTDHPPGLDVLEELSVDYRVSGAHRFDGARPPPRDGGRAPRGVRHVPACRPPNREHPRTPLPARSCHVCRTRASGRAVTAPWRELAPHPGPGAIVS